MGFLAVLGALGERLRAQPELQQDDGMAYVQGSRAAGCGRVCVPGELNEPQHQQPGDEKQVPRFIQFQGLQTCSSSCPRHKPPTGTPYPFPLPQLSQLVPEQVCEPACRHSPQEVGQRVEIPDVELVVEGAAEADANEVGGEEGRNDLYAVVKVKGRSVCGGTIPKQRGNSF